MTVEETVRLYIGSFLFAYTLIVSYPLFIYSWMQLNKYHNEKYFNLRGVALIVMETVVMFMSICIFIPIKICNEDLQIFSLSSTTLNIIEAFDVSFILAIFMILCIRIWCLNYSHCLQLEIVNSSWKAQLDTFRINKDSFYTKYQHSLGSISFLTKWCTVIYIVLCSVFFILMFISITTGYILLIIYYLFTIIVITGLWIKYPKFKDHWMIRDELKTSILYGIIVIIGGVIVMVIISMSGIPGISAIGPYVQVIWFNGLLYIAIIRNVKLNVTNPEMDRLSDGSSTQQDGIQNKDGYIGLDEIINNKHGYEEFMTYLVEEFSSENLCFATEYSQFRESLKLNEKQMTLMGCNLIFNTALTEQQSTFKLTDMDCKKFIDVVLKLYDKYIRFDGIYEINISYQTRLKLAVLIDDKYKNDIKYLDMNGNDNIPQYLGKNNLAQSIVIIIPILETCLYEIMRLLQSSFCRFKRTNRWNQLIKALQTETEAIN